MRQVLTVLLAYAIWIVASAGSVLDLLLFRAALNQSYIIARMPKTAFHFIDRGSLFIFGAVCLFLVVLGEGYFHDGAQQGDLKRRAVRVLGLEAMLAAILYLIPPLMTAL